MVLCLALPKPLHHLASDGRIQEGLPGVHAPDPIDEVVSANVFEDVASGSSHDRGKERVVVVEGRENQHLDLWVATADFSTDVNARAVGQPGVEHGDIGSDGRYSSLRLGSRRRLADDRDAIGRLDQLTKTPPHDLVVVEQIHADICHMSIVAHGDGHGRGTLGPTFQALGPSRNRQVRDCLEHRETSELMSAMSRIELDAVVAAATRAPSILNTQPWRFRASGEESDQFDVIDLWADSSRKLAELDPRGREMLISCGAALFNLTLAVAALGRSNTCELFPDENHPEWLASVVLQGKHRTSEEEDALFSALQARRTSRQPFDRDDVSPSIIARLQRAAEQEGTRLDEPPDSQQANVVALLHEADAAQRNDEALVAEVQTWVGQDAPRGAGIPANRLGPRPKGPSHPVRDLSLGASVPDRGRARFPHPGKLLLLLTRSDTPMDQINAGQALERIWLTATVEGIAVALHTSPTEVPELRPLLRDPDSAIGVPQIVLRLGYGPTPEPTPRRGVVDVLETSARPHSVTS